MSSRCSRVAGTPRLTGSKITPSCPAVIFILLLFLLSLHGSVSQSEQFNKDHQSSNKQHNVDWSSPLSVLRAVGRSITTSSVLTINLTNAVVLFLLKLLVIAGGILGKLSFWTYPGLGGFPFTPFGRSFQDGDSKLFAQMSSAILTQEDIRWASIYMWSLNKRDFSCLLRLACENPEPAHIYSRAGELLASAAHWTSETLKWKGIYNPKYSKILDSVKLASNKNSSTDCKRVYPCDAPFVRGNKYKIVKSSKGSK